MQHKSSGLAAFSVAVSLATGAACAAPSFVNGIVIAGDTLDATGAAGAN
jgi:hypothetical protein